MPKCLNLNDFCISSRNDSRNAVAKNLLTATFSTVRRLALLVSPGFEPRQRESKSLVLPLHHETTQQEQPAWAAGILLPQPRRCGKPKLCITCTTLPADRSRQNQRISRLRCQFMSASRPLSSFMAMLSIWLRVAMREASSASSSAMALRRAAQCSTRESKLASVSW